MGRCLDLDSNIAGDFARAPQGGVWNMGISSFYLGSRAAGCFSSPRFPDDKSGPQSSLQSGRVEDGPDVGLLAVASFPALAQESTLGEWSQADQGMWAMAWSVTLALSLEPS